MPFFFDLSSLVPLVERNPFKPLVVPDVFRNALLNETAAEVLEAEEEIAAEPIVDTGLPIPAHYDFDMMRAIVQDPFRLFVYWQLKDSPFDRLRKMFPVAEADGFHTALKLVDETNNIAVFFSAAYAREYWFSVFPDRSYRVELGVRSPKYGFIKLLNSQTVRTPRGGPSDQAAPEEQYTIAADAYLEVLRESHLVPERAFTVDGLLPRTDAAPADARNAVWESLPASFRRIMQAIGDIQSGRDYERWWERLGQEELAGQVREFLGIIAEMGDGELGYMLLLRYLPELLRRAILAEAQDNGHLPVQGAPRQEAPGQGAGQGAIGQEAWQGSPYSPERTAEMRKVEWQIDKPITLYLAERLGQVASEMNLNSSSDYAPQPPVSGAQPVGQPPEQPPGQGSGQGPWLPSMRS